MIERVVDFFVAPSSSDDEQRMMGDWLRRIFLTAIVILIPYGLIAFLRKLDSETYLFIFIFVFIFIGLIFLLNKGYVRLAILLFNLSGMLGMLYAVYRFGGVRSPSFSALVITIIIVALFLRGRLLVFTTVINVLAGFVLLLAEQSGRYTPDTNYVTPFNSWLANAITFIIAANLVGIATRQVRFALQRASEEIDERRKAEDALREKTRYHTALHETTLAIINRLELIPLLESILSRAEELAGTQHGYIDLIMPDGKGVRQQVGHGVFAEFDGVIVPAGLGVSGQVIESGTTKVIDDYRIWPARIPAYNEAGFRTITAVPLNVNDQVVGIIGLAHVDPMKKFSATQLEFLDHFAELASLAMENSRLYQAAQEELRERKLTQEALSDSQENLRQALDAARMGTWDFDMKTGILKWSDNIYSIYDIEKEDFPQTAQSYLDVIYPADLERVRDEMEKNLSCSGQSFSIEHRMILRDKSVHWLEGTGKIYCDEHGKTIGIAGTVMDITERKEAEQALQWANTRLQIDTSMLERRSTLLQVAAEVSRAASAILDPAKLSQQVVELVQERFKLYYVGLFLVDEKGDWAILQAATGPAGKKLLKGGQRLPVGDTSMVGWSIAHRQPRIALDVGEEAVRFSNPLLPLTRSEVTLPLIVRGQVLGGLTIQSDIEAAFNDEDITTFQTMTDQLANAIMNARLYDQLQRELEERKHAEEEVRLLNAELEARVQQRTADLRQRSAELQATNRELEAFSYSVSHDLRAPLRAIDGFSRILKEAVGDKLPPDAQHYMHKISDAAMEMGQLIDDILRLSRITRSELHENPVDLSALAISILDKIKAQETGRKVVTKIEAGLVANGDERLVQLALENLLSNAWKFTSKTKKAQICVGLTNNEEEQVFFIRDNGVGFDMAYADKLFGVFQRLHSSEEFPGTGIGLAIVQRVIHKHGGRIWAEAEKDKGATFYFTL